MSDLQIHLFLFGPLNNYGILIHDPVSNETVSVDCGDASLTREALDARGWKLNQIWITHHHPDHTAGVAEVKKLTGATVTGPVEKSKPIAGIDRHVWQGDVLTLGGHRVDVIATPGHTLDLVNYYLPDDGMLFTGDTLFTLGCGRLFEGTPAQMSESLAKLGKLPASTKVYGGHEYTATNMAFCKDLHLQEPTLDIRMAHLQALLDRGEPTIPSTIGEELSFNPFMRLNDANIRKAVGMEGGAEHEVLGALRERRNAY